MAATPQKHSLISDKPNDWKPEDVIKAKPVGTGGWFPTGGQDMFGVKDWDLSPTTQGLLGFAAGLPVGGGSTKKAISNKLLQLGAKLKGGPARMVPAGHKTVIEFLKEIIQHGGTSPAKKKLADKIVKTINAGKPFTFDKKDIRLIRNIKDNTRKSVQLDKVGNILREEIMVNPYQSGAGRGYYLGLKETPMIDVDLPIGPMAHMGKQMTHGWETRGDFLKQFVKFLKSDKGKSKQFRLYETPGGYRLWDTSQRIKRPLDYMKTGTPDILGQDISYTSNLGQGYFFSRLSPKPGRLGDYIARFDDTYGYGTPIKQNLDEIIRYHDQPIELIKNLQAEGSAKQLGGLFKLLKDIE